MKFLDKVKNMFTEEVIDEGTKDEVKIEQIVPSESNENKSLEDFNRIKQEEVKKEEKKPVFFTDDDFNDLDSYLKKSPDKIEKQEDYSVKKVESVEKESSREEKRLYSSTYNPTKSANDYLEKYSEENGDSKEPYQGNTPVEKKAPKFKPTPIISPVYGILDKNYHKEDIVNKNESNYKSVDGLSVDSIREKAYGTLEDELENTLFGSNSILFSEKDKKNKDDKPEKDFFDDLEEETSKENDDNLRDLENITMDIGKELDTLLKNNKKEEKRESDNLEEDDLFNLIDTMYDGDSDYDD